MFARGSRYRNLTESSPVDAKGDRLRGKDVRLNPPTPGQFSYRVGQGDRLDLLALKFYGDPTKWWQISDANPVPAFPPDLLDRQPIVEETFALDCPDFEARRESLKIALGAFGNVRTEERSFFEETVPRAPDFLESTITVTHGTATTPHAAIVAAIAAQGFRLLRSFAWAEATQAVDAFSFDDPRAKEQWDRLLATWRQTPGVVEVRSFVTEKKLIVTYNAAMLRGGRQAIVDGIKLAGFAIVDEPHPTTQLGATITVPPNQIT